MIAGSVKDLQALVCVGIGLSPDVTMPVDLVVDTGFAGGLALPQALIDELRLPYIEATVAILADGSRADVDVYAAPVHWFGRAVEVAVLAMEGRPLLGTSLLRELRMEADFVEGGAVRLLPL